MRRVGWPNFAAAARLAPRLGVEVGANETVPPHRFYDWLLLSGADREPRRFVVEAVLAKCLTTASPRDVYGSLYLSTRPDTEGEDLRLHTSLHFAASHAVRAGQSPHKVGRPPQYEPYTS